MNRNRIYLLATALVLILAPSCKREEMSCWQKKSKSVISFVLGGDMAVTKSSDLTSVMDPVSLSEYSGSSDLFLSETVTSLDAAYFPESEPETKGTPIYTENFDAIFGGFSATAFEPKDDGTELTSVWGADSYLTNGGVVPFQKDDSAKNTYYFDYSAGAPSDDKKINWPEDGYLLYFLQSPYAKTKGLGAKFYAPDETHPMGSIQFDYITPTGSGNGKDAEAQTDILFTSKLMNIETKDTDNEILFYHSLTAIKFKDGTTGNNDNDGDIIHINKVTFNNIVGSGHCTITPSYGDYTLKKSAACSIWTDLGEANCSYTQTFNGKVDEYTKEVGKGYVPDSFSANNIALNNLNDGLFTQTFMLIPQELGEKASMTVEYTIGKTTEIHKRTVSLSGLEWKAGELRTYTISINDVKVDISDIMSGDRTYKSSISTQNTGNVTAYLRCALVANWVYDDPKTSVKENVVVTACDIFTTGKFSKNEEGDLGFKTNWIVGDDGYIYYAKPVPAMRPTKYRLFETYEAPKGSPFKDAHLEIAIALQGVQFDEDKARVKAAWDVDKVRVMDISFDDNGIMIQTPTEQTIADVLYIEPEK